MNDNEQIFLPSGDGLSKITSQVVPNVEKVESCWFKTIKTIKLHRSYFY